MLEHYLRESLFKGPPPLQVERAPRRLRSKDRTRFTAVGNKKSKNVRLVFYGGSSHGRGYFGRVRKLYLDRGKANNIKYVLVQYDKPHGSGGEVYRQLKRYKKALAAAKSRYKGTPVEATYHVGFNFGGRVDNKYDRRDKNAFTELLRSQKGLTNNVVVMTSPVSKKGWRLSKHRDRWRQEGSTLANSIGGITYLNAADHPSQNLRDNVHLTTGGYKRSGRARLPKLPYVVETGTVGRPTPHKVPGPPSTRLPQKKKPESELEKLKRQHRYLTDRDAEYGDVSAEKSRIESQINKIEAKSSGPAYTPKYKTSEYAERGNYKNIANRIHKNYGKIIDDIVDKRGGSYEDKRHLKLFLVGTIAAETGGKPEGRGPVLGDKVDRYGKPLRAYGLTQFLPGTARAMATKKLGMSGADFDKKWKSGGWKDPSFMIKLATAYYGDLKSDIQNRYKKIHRQDIKGDDLLNAMHIAYSHGPGNPFFVKRLKRGDFSPKGFSSGSAAPGYNSKAANTRKHYTKHLSADIQQRPMVDYGDRSPRSAPESSGDVWYNRLKAKKAKVPPSKPPQKKSKKDPTSSQASESKPKPQVAQVRHQAEQSKPQAEQPKSQVAQVRHQAEQPKPQAEQPRPQVTQPKPQVAQPKPQAEQPRPQVTQPRPQVAQVRHQAEQPRPNPPLVLQNRKTQSIPTQGQPLMVSLAGAFEQSINKKKLSKSIFRLEEYREI